MNRMSMTFFVAAGLWRAFGFAVEEKWHVTETSWPEPDGLIGVWIDDNMSS